MPQSFKGQSLPPIKLETLYGGLASASSLKIHYQKPSGAKGFWTATYTGTQLVYQPSPGDINESGVWQFQAHIVVGGKDAYGEIAKEKFALTIE
jgi:hypothetical protein